MSKMYKSFYQGDINNFEIDFFWSIYKNDAISPVKINWFNKILQCNVTNKACGHCNNGGSVPDCVTVCLTPGKFDPTKVIEWGRKTRGDLKFGVRIQNHAMFIQYQQELLDTMFLTKLKHYVINTR